MDYILLENCEKFAINCSSASPFCLNIISMCFDTEYSISEYSLEETGYRVGTQ